MAALAAQAEHGHGLHQLARLGAQAAGCGGAFFHQGGVLLRGFVHAHDEEEDAKQKKEEPGKPRPDTRQEAEEHPVWSLLSSHPDTVRRAQELTQGHAPHCS